MLWAATLWEEVIPQEQVPGGLDNVHAHSEELAEVPGLRLCRPDMAGCPVLDIPGIGIEVG